MPRLALIPVVLRRSRLVALIVGLASIVLLMAGTHREFGAQFRAGHFASCGDACLKIGRADPTERRYTRSSTALGPIGLFSIELVHPEWGLAWRPFHVHMPEDFGRLGSNYLAFPLWQIALASFALAAWSHGRLGAARRTPDQCHDCGYDLVGCPKSQGSLTCPECGRTSPIPRPV